MSDSTFFELPDFRRRGAKVLLASVFLLGHLLGVLLSGSASELLFPVMRALPGSRATLAGLLAAAALPLVCSACAVYLRQTLLLFPIAFWKAFFFSYVAFGLFRAWGSAGWLLTGLSLFSATAAMPALYWYWLRHIGGSPFRWADAGLTLAVLVVIGIIDYCLIGPFLAEIITF